MNGKPIRCIRCYRHRPGGRCDFCPLHQDNRHLYRPVGNGWYLKRESDDFTRPPTSLDKEKGD